jgi:fumarate reductase subunit D
MAAADPTEPLWWSLFAAGGVLTALFVPAHVAFQHLFEAVGLPVATASYDRTRRLVSQPLVALYVLALTSLSFFHWAHRFRYYVMDFGISGARRPIAWICYGSAIVGTLAAMRTVARVQVRKD